MIGIDSLKINIEVERSKKWFIGDVVKLSDILPIDIENMCVEIIDCEEQKNGFYNIKAVKADGTDTLYRLPWTKIYLYGLKHYCPECSEEKEMDIHIQQIIYNFENNNGAVLIKLRCNSCKYTEQQHIFEETTHTDRENKITIHKGVLNNQEEKING